jgi:hypothetical protein
MAAPGERGVLTQVEVIHPDGKTAIVTLLFPRVLAGKRWMGINVCECGESIHYSWDQGRAVQKATCSACGIVFVVKKTAQTEDGS